MVIIVEFEIIDIDNSEMHEIIIGQGNFTIKTILDLYNALIGSSQGIKFGVAMNEAKPQLTRGEGNDDKLKELASKLALKIGGGHVFVCYITNAFPIHCLKAIKSIPTVVTVFAATSNPLQVIVTNTNLGRGIIGVIDGLSAMKIENEEEKKQRNELLDKFGYTTR